MEQFLFKNKNTINKEEMKFLIGVADCADQEEIFDMLNTTTSSHESHNSSIENDKHFEPVEVMVKINAESGNKSAMTLHRNFETLDSEECNRLFSDLGAKAQENFDFF